MANSERQGEMHMSIEIGLLDSTVQVVVQGRLGTEEPATVYIPVTASHARYLASRLLGGAAEVDPAGHREILRQIESLVVASICESETKH